MTIIARYIRTHYKTKTVTEMAYNLGVTPFFVSELLVQIKKELDEYDEPSESEMFGRSQEKLALITFIKTHQEGVLVDIARRRLSDMDLLR